MNFRRIGATEELAAFSARFKESSGGTEFPIEYLRASSVVAGFDAQGTMKCGYLLAPGPVMRWPKLLPQPTEFQRRIPPERVMELNGVWLAPELRRRAEAGMLWVKIGRDIASQPAPFVTFAVDSRKTGLVRLYRPVISGNVYSGPLIIPSPPHAQVFWSRRWRFRCLIGLYAFALVRRFMNGKSS